MGMVWFSVIKKVRKTQMITKAENPQMATITTCWCKRFDFSVVLVCSACGGNVGSVFSVRKPIFLMKWYLDFRNVYFWW